MSTEKSCKNAFRAGKTFYDYIKPQEFSLPVTVMKYLWQTPSNPEGHEKLIQTCKLFFAKNRVLSFPSLCIQSDYWTYCPKKDCKCYEGGYCPFRQNICLEKMECKIWPTFDLFINVPHFPTTLMSKLYRSDAKQIILHSNINYLKDILLLGSSAVDLTLGACVIGDNGQHIFAEDYIECFPLLQAISLNWAAEGSPPPCKNFEKLFTLLQKRTDFFELQLLGLLDDFKIETVLECLKQKKIQFKTTIAFEDASLPEIVKRLENIVDEIIETKYYDYCPPFIWSYFLKKQRTQKFIDMASKIDGYRTGKFKK